MNGISDFPPNFVANNQIDVDSVRNSSAKAVLCNSCNEQLPATARYLDCMEFLCYACHNAHSRVRVTKDHRVSFFYFRCLTWIQLTRIVTAKNFELPNSLNNSRCIIKKKKKGSIHRVIRVFEFKRGRPNILYYYFQNTFLWKISLTHILCTGTSVSYTHLTLPTIYSV